MSQARTHEYKAGLVSLNENKRHLGQYFAGVYCGFDTITTPGGNDITVGHTNTGVVVTKPDNTLNTQAGIICSKHGVIISEDGIIGPLTLVTNAGNASDRYDLLVMTHNYVLLAGGQAATYSIQQGPLSNPTIPALAYPNNSVLIGVIKLKAGATAVQAITDMVTPPAVNVIPNGTYTREKANGMGGQYSAKLNLPNKYTKQNSNADAASLNYTVLSGDDIQLEVTQESNLYKHVYIGANPTVLARWIKKPVNGEGTIITIQNQLVDYLSLYHDYTGAAPTGYAKIWVPPHLKNFPAASPNGTITVGNSGTITLQYIGTTWFVISAAFQEATTLAAYYALFNPNPTPNTAYFNGSLTGVSIGTNIGMGVLSLPSGIPVSLSAGEVKVNATGLYKVELFWRLTDRDVFTRLLLGTNSSNDPAWGYQQSPLSSEDDYTTAVAMIEVSQIVKNLTTTVSISNGTKLQPYISPSGFTVSTVEVIMAITKLS